MTLSPLTNAVLFAVVATVLLVLSATSTRWFLFASGFVLPLSTPHLVVGVNLFWFNIIGFIALATLPIAPRSASSKGGWNVSRGFLGLGAYSTLVSLTWMVAEYGMLERYRLARYIGLGPAQSLYKMPVQLISFLMICLAFYVIPARATRAKEVYAGFRGYIFGLAASILTGLALLVSTGSGSIDERGALTFRAAGARLTRLGGLSGEPKTLGAFLVVALGLMIAYSLGGARRNGAFMKRPVIWAMTFTAALFLTYSTSAWLAFAAVLCITPVVRRGVQGRFVIPTIIGVAIVATTQLPVLRAVVDERVVARVFEADTQEVAGSKDNYVLDVYMDKPEFFVVGFGLGGTDLEATPYLLKDPKYDPQLQYVRTPTPSTTGARLLGDIGLIGMVLLALCAGSWHRRLAKQRLTPLSVFVVAAGVGIMFQSLNSLAAFLFISGGALTLETLARKGAAETASRPGDAEVPGRRPG